MEKKKESKEEEAKLKEKSKSEEDRVLKFVLLFIGVFFLVLIVSFFVMRSQNTPDYRGITFNTIQEGELTFYQASFPVLYKGKTTDYNIYLRNNPKKLDKEVPFEGEIDSIKDTVINITKEFDCEGDQVIAIANIVNLYNAIGKDIMRDDNASCDELGRYMYIVIQEGEETSIEQFGPGCYNINIKGCEILEGTERFIAEMLVKINSDIYGK